MAIQTLSEARQQQHRWLAWDRPAGLSGFVFPWLTLSLIAVFAAVFVIEVRAGGGSERIPAITLAALGGSSRRLAEAGQWYRLLSAPFLHSSFSHLAGNCFAFLLSGYALERLVGRAWMFGIFAVGALAGALASLAWLAPATISVGASGAIMAMLVALFMTSFRMPAGRKRRLIQFRTAAIAIPSLIPVSRVAAAGTAMPQIDYGAHFGGAAFGLLLGFLLLQSWEDESPLPGLRPFAAAFAGIAVLGFASSAYAVARQYPSFPTADSFIPTAQYPHGAVEIATKANGLLADYPRDPAAHFFAAMARLQHRDRAGAEPELRMALALADAPPFLAPPSVASTIRGTLALTVLEQGRRPEAVAIARDLCVARGEGAPAARVAASLAKTGLCKG